MTTLSRVTTWSSGNAMALLLVCPTGNRKEAAIAQEKTRMATPIALNGRSRLVLIKAHGKVLPELENLPASSAIPDGGKTRRPKEKCLQPSGVATATGNTERYRAQLAPAVHVTTTRELT